MTKEATLEEIIYNIKNLDETLDLYCPNEAMHLSKETTLLLLDKDEVTSFSNLNKFRYVLGLYTIKDILDNLQLQSNACTLEDGIEAINFYLKNDAFLEKN